MLQLISEPLSLQCIIVAREGSERACEVEVFTNLLRLDASEKLKEDRTRSLPGARSAYQVVENIRICGT